MKSSAPTLLLVLAASAALSTAMAGDGPGHEGPHGLMRADTNGDGKVSKQEADALHDKMQSEWFARLDSNQDGYLDAEEIQKGRDQRQQRRGEMKAHMQDRFNEADANQDGQISLDEAQAKMPRLAERFTALDTDKNGLLSKEEIKQGRPDRGKPKN